MSSVSSHSSGPCYRYLDDDGNLSTSFEISVYIQVAQMAQLNGYGYFKVYRAQRHWETQGGPVDARPSSLLLPIYRWLMWFMCGCLLAGRLVVTIQRYSYTRPNNLSSSVAYGISNMLTQTSYELVTFAFMSPGAGKRTYRRSQQLAVVWGVVCGLVKFVAAITSHTQQDGLAVVLEQSWGVALFVFYTILWLWPDTRLLLRRPALRRYSRFWSLVYGLHVVWMCLRFQLIDAGYCLYVSHLAVIVFFAPWVVYSACKEDSFYWQGAAVFNGTHQRSIATVLGGFLSPSLASDVSQVDAFHVPLINFAALTIDEKNQQQDASINQDKLHLPSRWSVQTLHSNPTNSSGRSTSTNGSPRADIDSSVYTKQNNDLYVIDHGSMARVYKGTYKARPVAIKLQYAPELTRELVENQFEEASVMYMVSHSHVTEVKGVCVMPPAVALVMELCVGSLHKMVHKANFYDCLRAYGRWAGNILQNRNRPYVPSHRDNVGVTQRQAYRVAPQNQDLMPPSIATVLVSALDMNLLTTLSELTPPVQGAANPIACVCRNEPYDLDVRVPFSNECFLTKHSTAAMNKFLFSPFLHRRFRERECVCGSEESLPLLPWAIGYRTMIDVITGVATLHGQRNPVIHLDIKSGNFLVGSRGIVKIADLELSTRLPHVDVCIAPHIKPMKDNIQKQHQCHEKCVYRNLSIYTDEVLAKVHETEHQLETIGTGNLYECEACQSCHSSYITPSTYAQPCIMPLLGGKPMVCPCSFVTTYYSSNVNNSYTQRSYPFYRFSHALSVEANKTALHTIQNKKPQYKEDHYTEPSSSLSSPHFKVLQTRVPQSFQQVRSNLEMEYGDSYMSSGNSNTRNEEDNWVPKIPLPFEAPVETPLKKRQGVIRGVLNNQFGNKDTASVKDASSAKDIPVHISANNYASNLYTASNLHISAANNKEVGSSESVDNPSGPYPQSSPPIVPSSITDENKNEEDPCSITDENKNDEDHENTENNDTITQLPTIRDHTSDIQETVIAVIPQEEEEVVTNTTDTTNTNMNFNIVSIPNDNPNYAEIHAFMSHSPIPLVDIDSCTTGSSELIKSSSQIGTPMKTPQHWLSTSGLNNPAVLFRSDVSVDKDTMQHNTLAKPPIFTVLSEKSTSGNHHTNNIASPHSTIYRSSTGMMNSNNNSNSNMNSFKSPKPPKSVATLLPSAGLPQDRFNMTTSLELVPIFNEEMQRSDMHSLDAVSVKANLLKELNKRRQMTTLLTEKQRSWMKTNYPSEAIELTNFNSQVQLNDAAVATINTSPEDPLGVCPDVHIGWNFTVKQGMQAHQILYDNLKYVDDNNMIFLHGSDTGNVPLYAKSTRHMSMTRLLSRKDTQGQSGLSGMPELPRRNSFYLQNDSSLSNGLKRTKTVYTDDNLDVLKNRTYKKSLQRDAHSYLLSPMNHAALIPDLDIGVHIDVEEEEEVDLGRQKLSSHSPIAVNDEEEEVTLADTNPPIHVRGVYIPLKQCAAQGYVLNITLMTNTGYLVMLKTSRKNNRNIQLDSNLLGWMLPVSHLSKKPELPSNGSATVEKTQPEDTLCCGIHLDDGVGLNHEEEARRHRKKQKIEEDIALEPEVAQPYKASSVYLEEYEPYEWTQLPPRDQIVSVTEHEEAKFSGQGLLRKKVEVEKFPPGHALFKQNTKPSMSRCCSLVKKHPMKSNTNPLIVPQCLYWLAPEVIRLEPIGVKTDVYSLGCVLYEIQHRKVPFLEMDIMYQNVCRKDMALYNTLCERYFIDYGVTPPLEYKANQCLSADVRLARAIAYGHIRPHIASHVPLAMRGVQRRLWHPDPEARPHSIVALLWTRVIFARTAATSMDEDTVLGSDGYYLWQQTEKEAQWQGLDIQKIEEQVISMEQEEHQRENNLLKSDPNGVFWYGCLCCRRTFTEDAQRAYPLPNEAHSQENIDQFYDAAENLSIYSELSD